MEKFQSPESLSVGQVSGLIALGISLATFSIPLLSGVILLYYHDKTASAATWSVISRQLQLSYWPSLLWSDATTVKNVDRRVSAVAYLNIVCALVIMIAGIVTPLGLGDAVAADGEQWRGFAYIPDTSTFGRSIQPRPDMPPSRLCRTYHCPGVILETAPNITAHTVVPENITAMFSSANSGSTVARLFDIHYRSWQKRTDPRLDGGEPYLVGTYRRVDSLLNMEKIAPLEGVIADLESGGLGFRNHTAPSGLEHGSSWGEDILWIEPEFACRETNLSLELTYHQDMSMQEVHLVDDGGFADLRHGDPNDGWPDLNYTYPDLQLRASRTAWLHNLLLATLLNLTDVEGGMDGIDTSVGNRYKFNSTLAADAVLPLGVRTERLNIISTWLDLPTYSQDTEGNVLRDGEPLGSLEEHPYDFAAYRFTQLQGLCDGKPLGLFTNVTDFNAECSYFYASPSRVDGGSPLEQEDGSRWKIPMHVCAGGVKAAVKTVSFSMNGTASLESLSVNNVEDKSYTAESDYPLWSVENHWYPGNEGSVFGPLWGIVDDSYEGTEGYNFTRSPTFYLPYTDWAAFWNEPADSLAGKTAPYGIMGHVMHQVFSKGLTNPYAGQYDGSSALALKSRWRDLSSAPGSTERILRLIWTDIMANAVVGRNSREGNPDISSGEVTTYARKITYDMRYAVAAILLLALWVLLGIASCFTGAYFNRFATRMRQLLNDTSVGRTAAAASYPDTKQYLRSTTTEWVDIVGPKTLSLGSQSNGESTAAESYNLETVPKPGGDEERPANEAS